MKYFLTCFIILFFINFSAIASKHSSLIEDLPLTNTMQEVAEDFVAFEKPSGRIMQLTVITTESNKEILSFYNKSLHQLGWHKKGQNSFARDNEVMLIEIDKRSKNNYVTFTITSN